jgi:hypothetical protein
MNQQVAISDQRLPMQSVPLSAGAGGASIAPQNLGEVVKFAEVMCRADIALPPHLRGNAGACMAVALQALEWQMSPFAVASKSYAVKGAIAYEAQLIAAVVNTRSGIRGRLKYEYRGDGDELTCIVSGVLDGEVCSYETPACGAIQPKNSPLWKTDPRQQLGYYAARSWARRHCPEVILGVYDRDEVEHVGPSDAKDVTPSVMQRLQARQEPVHAREGFDPAHVTRETGALTGEPQSEPEPPSVDIGDEAGNRHEDPLPSPATDRSEPAAADPSSEGTDPPAGPSGDDSSEGVDAVARMLMEECVDNMLRDAFSEPKDQQSAKIEKLRAVFLEPQNLGAYPDFVNRCADTAARIIGKPGERDRAREYLLGRIPA